MRSSPACIVVMDVAIALVRCSPSPDRTATETGPVIEYRLVSDSARSGWSRAELNGDVFYLAPDAVISDDDIAHLIAERTTDGLVVDVLLKPDAASRLNAATAEWLGGRMALLVNSDVHGAFPVRSEIPASDGSVQMALILSGDKAQRIATQLRDRWPGP